MERIFKKRGLEVYDDNGSLILCHEKTNLQITVHETADGIGFTTDSDITKRTDFIINGGVNITISKYRG